MLSRGSCLGCLWCALCIHHVRSSRSRFIVGRLPLDRNCIGHLFCTLHRLWYWCRWLQLRGAFSCSRQSASHWPLSTAASLRILNRHCWRRRLSWDRLQRTVCDLLIACQGYQVCESDVLALNETRQVDIRPALVHTHLFQRGSHTLGKFYFLLAIQRLGVFHQAENYGLVVSCTAHISNMFCYFVDLILKCQVKADDYYVVVAIRAT